MSGSIAEFGLAASALAFVGAVAALSCVGLGLMRASLAFLEAARNALVANVLLVSLACFTLIWSFVIKDYSVLYVAQNSNSHLPLFYRITAMWGAHEGSLLLWLWYLTLFAATAVLLHWRTYPLSMPYIMGVLSALQIGFLGFILFLSNPFTLAKPALLEGRDLNPLLQDPALAIHPPLLYMGYVGFSVPFAFAIAALLRGYSGGEWVIAIRRWTLFSWAALTSGMLLGGYWAYYELGWGGYWAWDPVENASLLPWLTATAFLHSIMAQEQRSLFQTWNVFLIVTTFLLSLLGTFLVRSGVLTSVHAFASDPDRGIYILLFLGLSAIGSYGLMFVRAGRLSTATLSPHVPSWLSRETALLLNNLFLLAGAAIVLVGTLYPLLLEVLTGERVSVAAPYFNHAMMPIMVGLVLLMGIGPVIPWRRAKAARLKSALSLPAVAALVSAALALAFGISSAVIILSIMVIAFAATLIVIDVARGARAYASAKDVPLLAALWALFAKSPRRYGGLLVHLGVLVLLSGVVASGGLQKTVSLTLADNDRFIIGPYVLAFQGRQVISAPNYTARQASFAVLENGEPTAVLYPERRSYPRGNMTTTEAAILTTLLGDLYVVIGEDEPDGKLAVRAYWNPLVIWIWIGWAVMLAGVGAAVWQAAPQAYRLRKAALA